MHCQKWSSSRRPGFHVPVQTGVRCCRLYRKVGSSFEGLPGAPRWRLLDSRAISRDETPGFADRSHDRGALMPKELCKQRQPKLVLLLGARQGYLRISAAQSQKTFRDETTSAPPRGTAPQGSGLTGRDVHAGGNNLRGKARPPVAGRMTGCYARRWHRAGPRS